MKSDESYTVEDCVNEWLKKGLKGRDQQGTVRNYRSMAVHHIYPYIGMRKSKTLTAGDLDDWLED
ncbi:hypothetical protein [Nonomuraea monospora]|uniref:hypothetical protein n=1 Tax=Nonomuraea monospora TaxID=568818 RepID=UPI0031CE4AA8